MAINTKTYISKSNTIVRGSEVNLSLNPIMELNYGNLLTRGLIYFDHNKIRKLVEDKTYPSLGKLKHVLHMTNAASVNERNINRCLFDKKGGNERLRAVSFDIILFLIPKYWDGGRGFDYTKDLYNFPERGVSVGGSSWYKCKNYSRWDNEGIYSTNNLSRELDKFTSEQGNESDIIIAYQHFDKGNEDIEIDITDTVNKFIDGSLCNNGIGIAFSPKFENLNLDAGQYVGFFTNNTNTFFEPYIETTYDDVISDDRLLFYLDKNNRLYFYATVSGKLVNLDNNPSVLINGKEYASEQATRGVYFTEVKLASSEIEPDTMVYDLWTNINYNGERLEDVELSFVTKEKTGYMSMGLPNEASNKRFDVSVYGIKHNESVRQGDVRKLTVECVIPYTTNQQTLDADVMYRLYIKDNEREIDVIRYSRTERAYNENYFLLNTSEMLPSRYYIDIKIRQGFEEIYHREILCFNITDNITNHFD